MLNRRFDFQVGDLVGVVGSMFGPVVGAKIKIHVVYVRGLWVLRHVCSHEVIEPAQYIVFCFASNYIPRYILLLYIVKNYASKRSRKNYASKRATIINNL